MLQDLTYLDSRPQDIEIDREINHKENFYSRIGDKDQLKWKMNTTSWGMKTRQRLWPKARKRKLKWNSETL